jgi:hypothetical protein
MSATFKNAVGVLFATALAVSASPSFAQSSKGEAAQFVKRCRDVINFSSSQKSDSVVDMNMGFCLGLMDGLRGSNYFLKKAKSEAAFCEPEWFKNDDLAKAFVATVDKNPDLLELRGSLAALVALRSAFPCKSSN